MRFVQAVRQWWRAQRFLSYLGWEIDSWGSWDSRILTQYSWSGPPDAAQAAIGQAIRVDGRPGRVVAGCAESVTIEWQE